MSAVALELVAGCDGDLTVTALAEYVGRDPGLAARILRVANSSFYGLPRQVSTIQDAVVVLGISTVRNLALAASLSKAFRGVTNDAFDYMAFWRRSMMVARYAALLAAQTRQLAGTAYAAGLFHAIGEAVMALCLKEAYATLWKQHSNRADLLRAEQAKFGFNHVEVGMAAARRWNFPEVIVNAIGYDEGICCEPFCAETALVYLAYRYVAREDREADQDMELACRRLGTDWVTLSRDFPEKSQIEAEVGMMLHG
ncbi:MAG: HDOD domain-containing protein [Pseudomonadota bacterium]